MFVGEARSLPHSGAPGKCYTQVGLTCKHMTRLERPAKDKHSSLSQTLVNYGRKEFYNVDVRSRSRTMQSLTMSNKWVTLKKYHSSKMKNLFGRLDILFSVWCALTSLIDETDSVIDIKSRLFLKTVDKNRRAAFHSFCAKKLFSHLRNVRGCGWPWFIFLPLPIDSCCQLTVANWHQKCNYIFDARLATFCHCCE